MLFKAFLVACFWYGSVHSLAIGATGGKDCENLLGGLERIGFSVDVRHYDPFAQNGSDNGLRQKVLNMNCKKMAVESLNNGTTFDVPAEPFNIVTAKDTQNVHFTVSNAAQYRLQLSQYFGNDEKGVGWFSKSKSYKQMSHFYDNNTVNFLFSGTKQIVYEAGIYEQDTVFSRNATRDLNELPRNFTNQTRKAFEEHFAKYGTHLIVGVLGGGVSWRIDEIKLCPFHDTAIGLIQNQRLRASVAKIFGLNNANLSPRVGGTSKNVSEEAWLKSVSEKPAAINILLQPLYIYIEDPEQKRALEEATVSLMMQAELSVQADTLQNLNSKLRQKKKEQLGSKIAQELKNLDTWKGKLKFSVEEEFKVETLKMEVMDLTADVQN